MNKYITLSNLQDYTTKLVEKLKTMFSPAIFVTPEMYGAVGDGNTDDTNALVECFSHCGNIVFGANKTYLVTSTIKVRSNTYVDMNGSTIVCTDKHIFFNFDPSDTPLEYFGNGNIAIKNGTIEGGCVSFAHGKNILIDNMVFRHCINDHFIEICACDHFTVSNSSFIGMLELEQASLEYINFDPCIYSSFPHFNSESNPTYDHTVCKNIFIHNNTLRNDLYPYNAMKNGIGTHVVDGTTNLHENVNITNNIVENSTNCAISILGCTKSRIVNNRVLTTQSPFRVGYGDGNVVSENVAEVASLSALINFWFPVFNITIDDNTVLNTTGYDTSGLKIITGNIDGSTFAKLQRTYLSYMDGNDYTADFALSAFNEFIFSTGSVGAGTYREDRIRSYYNRGFQPGETYPFMAFNENAPVRQAITFSGDGSKNVHSTAELRSMYVAADFTRKW